MKDIKVEEASRAVKLGVDVRIEGLKDERDNIVRNP